MPPASIHNIQQQYQEYAFIDPAVPEGMKANAVVDAMTYWQPMKDRLSRSFEAPFKWYFIVFKPYNDIYEKKRDWFQSKGIDRCRKSLKSSTYILTRELLASKTHINALVATDSPPSHNSDLCNKYKLYVNEFVSRQDRERVLIYITKEAKNRPYVKYQDYIISK